MLQSAAPLAGYQFYFIVSDSSLVNSRNLKKLTDPLQSVHKTYIGEVGGTESDDVCQYERGVLLSHHLVTDMADNMDWCYRSQSLSCLYNIMMYYVPGIRLAMINLRICKTVFSIHQK